MAYEFKITRNDKTPAAERDAKKNDAGFGKVFTDHMVQVIWDESLGGWQTPEVVPYGPLTLDPAAAVLHYAQEIFEGLKVYRHPDGKIVTFRPEKNAARFNRSAKRMALPEVPEELFVQAIHELVKVDVDWIPDNPSDSLYIRPFMIADETFLGVRSAKRARFMVIASPAGNYFAAGIKPIDIWLSTDYARAGNGGTGAAKCGGNYAASLIATDEAFKNGCSQVLFTDAYDRDTIDELGGMNLLLVHRDKKIITPALNGNILAGVTRESLLNLAADRGYTIEERAVSVSEWRDGVANGEIIEAFACGTAAVVAPIGALRGADGFAIEMPDNHDVTMSLREELTGIQHGRVEDKHGWLDVIA